MRSQDFWLEVGGRQTDQPVGRVVTRLSLEWEVWSSNLGPAKSNTVLSTTRHQCNISVKEAVLPGCNDAKMGSAKSLHALASSSRKIFWILENLFEGDLHRSTPKFCHILSFYYINLSLSNFIFRELKKVWFWRTHSRDPLIVAPPNFVMFYCVVIFTHPKDFMCLLWMVKK